MKDYSTYFVEGVREVYRDYRNLSWIGILSVASYIVLFGALLDSRTAYFTRLIGSIFPLFLGFLATRKYSRNAENDFLRILKTLPDDRRALFAERVGFSLSNSLLYMVTLSPVLLDFYFHVPPVRLSMALTFFVGLLVGFLSGIMGVFFSRSNTARANGYMTIFVLVSVAAISLLALLGGSPVVALIVGVLPPVQAAFAVQGFWDFVTFWPIALVGFVVVSAMLGFVIWGSWSSSLWGSGPKVNLKLLVSTVAVSLLVSSFVALNINKRDDLRSARASGSFSFDFSSVDGEPVQARPALSIGEWHEVTVTIGSGAIETENHDDVAVHLHGERLEVKPNKLSFDGGEENIERTIKIYPRYVRDVSGVQYILEADLSAGSQEYTSTRLITGYVDSLGDYNGYLVLASLIPIIGAIRRRLRVG